MPPLRRTALTFVPALPPFPAQGDLAVSVTVTGIGGSATPSTPSWTTTVIAPPTGLGSSTAVSPTSAEPGDTVVVSARGAQPNTGYVLKMGSSPSTCGAGLRLGGVVNADATGAIPSTSRVVPTNTTSGRRYLCFLRRAGPTELTLPTEFVVA